MGNYANFLRRIRKDYDKAEEHYQKALALEPESANSNSSHAIFLTNIRKDYDKAEEYYQKALVLDPDYANYNANYAQLFLITSRKSEAERYMKIAFANMDTEKELDRLLAEGHKSLHWNLDDNIKQAEKDGFKDIQLLEDYAKKITQE